jgi:hypothetical protein
MWRGIWREGYDFLAEWIGLERSGGEWIGMGLIEAITKGNKSGKTKRKI